MRKKKSSGGFPWHNLTTDAAASLLPPNGMPANTTMTVTVPQLTVPANFGLA